MPGAARQQHGAGPQQRQHPGRELRASCAMRQACAAQRGGGGARGAAPRQRQHPGRELRASCAMRQACAARRGGGGARGAGPRQRQHPGGGRRRRGAGGHAPPEGHGLLGVAAAAQRLAPVRLAALPLLAPTSLKKGPSRVMRRKQDRGRRACPQRWHQLNWRACRRVACSLVPVTTMRCWVMSCAMPA